MITVERLRVLVAIADAESLAGAARSLYLSQPTVSHHLDALEATMGVRLVERRPSGSRPTELGEMVVAQSRSILTRVSDLEGTVRTLREHGVAVVNIACFPSAASALLARPLAALREAGMRFRLTVCEPPEVVRSIAEQGVDVVLLYSEHEGGPRVPDWLQTERLFDDPLLVLLPRDHELARGPYVRVAQLLDEPWITTTGDGDAEHILLLRAFADTGHEPQFAIRADDFHVKQKLVAAGLGVSLLPRIALGQLIDGVVAVPVNDARFARRIDVGWRLNRAGAVVGLVTELRAEAARLLSSWPTTDPGL
jgi:DNA-binding transcriptional LysR family regulator